VIKKLKQLTQRKFVRNIAVVATGTASAQVIAVAFAPVITRLYGPEAFGLLGAFMAILAVVTPIAALAYPIAIVLPKSDEDAKGLAQLSAGLAIGMAILVAIVLLVTGDWFLELLSLQAIANFLLLIPLGMVFSAFLQILQQWLIRKNQFRITARITVIQALTMNTATAGIGLLHPVGAVLIVLATVGNALHASLLWLGVNNRSKLRLSKQWPIDNKGKEQYLSSIKSLAMRHRDFPIYRAPQDAINAFSQSLPILMLASLFGPSAAGFYALGKTVMGVPSALIGKSVGDVFYPRITEAAHNKENLFQLIWKTTFTLAVVGFAPFGLVIAFGPWLFSFTFGSEWATAGEYARWLALFFLFNFINKPCVAAVPVLGVQRGLLFYEIFSTGGKALGLFVGFHWFGSAVVAIALFSAIGVIAYSVMILWILWCSKKWNENAEAS